MPCEVWGLSWGSDAGFEPSEQGWILLQVGSVVSGIVYLAHPLVLLLLVGASGLGGENLCTSLELLQVVYQVYGKKHLVPLEPSVWLCGLDVLPTGKMGISIDSGFLWSTGHLGMGAGLCGA